MFLCLSSNASEIFQWGSLLSPQCCHGRPVFLPLRDRAFGGNCIGKARHVAGLFALWLATLIAPIRPRLF